MDTSSKFNPSRKAPSGVSTQEERGAGSWLAPGEVVTGSPASGKRGWSSPPTSAAAAEDRVTARSGRRRNAWLAPLGRRLPRREQEAVAQGNWRARDGTYPDPAAEADDDERGCGFGDVRV